MAQTTQNFDIDNQQLSLDNTNLVTISKGNSIQLPVVTSISALQSFANDVAIFDGSTWNKKTGDVQSNGGGFAGTLIRVNSTTYWERKTDYVTPEMFGAIGDGLIDDTTPIQNAINTRKDVHLSSKSYKVSSSLIVKKGTRIIGRGESNTIIKSTENIEIIKANGTGILANEDGFITDVELKDFTVIGENSFGVATAFAGIAWKHAYNWKITNIRVEKCLTGFLGTSDGFFWHFYLNSCEAIRCNTGYSYNLKNTLQSSPIQHVKCTARDGGIGMSINNNFTGFSFFGCEFARNTTGLLVLGNNTKAVHISGVSFEDNQTGIIVGDASNTPELSIIGCRFIAVTSTSYVAIQADRGSIFVGDGNTFDGYTNAIIVSNNVGICKINSSITSSVTNFVSHNSKTYNGSGDIFINGSSFRYTAIGSGYNKYLGTTPSIGNPNIITHFSANSGGSWNWVSGLTGESAYRTYMTADGKLQFGNGTSSPDAEIKRKSAGIIQLGTNNSFEVEGSITSSEIIINSTTKGFLPPRMTTAQKNAISSPAVGLMVFDTDLGKLCVRGNTAWETITSV